MKFDVEFTVSRLTLKLQHRAVDLAEKHQLEELLFPTGAAAETLSMLEPRSEHPQMHPSADLTFCFAFRFACSV